MNFLPSKIITTAKKNPQEEEIPTARFIPTSSSSSVLARQSIYVKPQIIFARFINQIPIFLCICAYFV